MMKTIAALLAAVLALFLFQAHIKSATMQLQMSWSLSRIEMADEPKEELDTIFDRVGNGYVAYKFDDLEKVTLRKLMAELDDYEGRELPDAEAERFIQKFEAILVRHEL
jgi:hypothetical protein